MKTMGQPVKWVCSYRHNTYLLCLLAPSQRRSSLDVCSQEARKRDALCAIVDAVIDAPETKNSHCLFAFLIGSQVVFARRQGTMNDITMDDSFGAMKDDADVAAPGSTKEDTDGDDSKS